LQRQTRNYLAIACLALCVASFPSSLWLFYQYQATRPSQPHPDLGLIHALNNHGSYAYLSDYDCTGLAILSYMFFIGFGLGIIVVKKRYTSAGIDHDLGDPTAEEYAVMLAVTLCYLFIIKFAGPRIVAAMVSHGIVLTFGTN